MGFGSVDVLLGHFLYFTKKYIKLYLDLNLFAYMKVAQKVTTHGCDPNHR